jgi:cupin fold WbuC family metalloprotein
MEKMDPLSGVTLIDPSLIESVSSAAARSPRLRINHNFHAGAADNPHRFLNVLREGTYVTPHRHLNPPKSEGFLVISGAVAIFLFDDAGKPVQTYVLGDSPRLPKARRGVGIDLPPGVWHTVAALTLEAVCYEVKPGPWIPSTDKEFAPWAPAEGDPAAAGYLAELLSGDGAGIESLGQ